MKQKKILVKRSDSITETMHTKEHYNPYQTGHGIHGNTKTRQDRSKQKRALQKELNNY